MPFLARSVPAARGEPVLNCGRSLDLEILRRRFALVGDFFVFDNLPLIQTAETSLLDRRNVDENVFSAATLPVAILAS
jgi:hypothetical protein